MFTYSLIADKSGILNHNIKVSAKSFNLFLKNLITNNTIKNGPYIMPITDITISIFKDFKEILKLTLEIYKKIFK